MGASKRYWVFTVIVNYAAFQPGSNSCRATPARGVHVTDEVEQRVLEQLEVLSQRYANVNIGRLNNEVTGYGGCEIANALANLEEQGAIEISNGRHFETDASVTLRSNPNSAS